MSKIFTFIKKLKQKLFRSEDQQLDLPQQVSQPAKPITTAPSDKIPSLPIEREPYFMQIGFDFGTSYSKCICRDIMTDKAWVFISPDSEQQELQFLMPSTLQLKDGKISCVQNCETQYIDSGLYHLKQALVDVALNKQDSFVLPIFRDLSGYSDRSSLQAFVKNCAVFYLARLLGAVRKKIRQQLPDFGKHPKDYMAVNLAVPVADAERKQINDLYNQVLCESWYLADTLADHPTMPLIELEALLRKSNQMCKERDSNDACFIYPEVSANVQGFIRSRMSSPGIYLFSDTGAATVDQSVFIFLRRDGAEYLNYLHAKVLPLGSSHIERHAANHSGLGDWQSLEKLRTMKEQGETTPELEKGRELIAKHLIRGTESTLAYTKGKKLYVPKQLHDIRVIFGGGGHCTHPYEKAVMRPFSGALFSKPITPDVIGLPIPPDLDLQGSETRWMRRLYVAYGLSFEKGMLAKFTYPKDIPDPDPDDIWHPHKQIPDAPGPEVC